MYPWILWLHSWLRWVVLGVLLVNLWRSVGGWRRGRPFSGADRGWKAAFSGVFGLQVTLGLLLQFALSPLTPSTLEGLRAAMPVRLLRFFAVEHIFVMVVAFACATAGSVLAKRAVTDAAKHRRWTVTLLIVTVLLLAAIPWPFMGLGRPWFRTF